MARKMTQGSQQYQGHLLTGAGHSGREAAVRGVRGRGRGRGRGGPIVGGGEAGSAVTEVAGQPPGGTGVCAGTLKLKLGHVANGECLGQLDEQRQPRRQPGAPLDAFQPGWGHADQPGHYRPGQALALAQDLVRSPIRFPARSSSIG
jgi:hypothetical protein